MCILDKQTYYSSHKMLYLTHAAAEVEFERTSYSVDEDAGFATLTVVSDIPAPVEFSVQVSFTDGTATC